MHKVPPKKIGLALGSGGARGWAHLGVLRRLRELGIHPHCIAGTSIGSIAGALYLTQTDETMAALAEELDWKRVAKLFFEVGIPRSGLISGKNMIRFLKEVIPARSFSELPVPFAAVSTDLASSKEIVFQEGDLFRAIRASVSIPGMFSPVRYQQMQLVDGGLLNPLPVDVCRRMGADYVIGVDVNLRLPSKVAPFRKKHEPRNLSPSIQNLLDNVVRWLPSLQDPVSQWTKRIEASMNQAPALPYYSIFEVMTRSFRLTENLVTRLKLEREPPDLLLQPAVADISTLDFHRGEEAIQLGVEAADEHLEELLFLTKPHLRFFEGEPSHGM